MAISRLLTGRSVAIVFLLISFACGEDPEIVIVPEVLVDYTVVASRTKNQIIDFVKSRSLPFPQSEIQYDVTVYKVTYKTKFNNTEIIASGLVSIPDTKNEIGMLSFQHGTIASNSEAPSETPATAFLMDFYAAMAGIGLIGVVPDLLGFGSSKNMLHPYYVLKPTADAVIDNLKAARELALVNKRKFNQRLFLAGYSQGGYATMAAHKAIETDGLENFQLIASFPASGGYDIKGVQEYFFKQTTYDQPFYIAFVAMAYRNSFGWTQPLTDFFQEPFASKIPGLFNGINSSGDINKQLTESIPALINPDLLSKIDADPKYKYIVDAFNANSLDGWVPKTRMFMYHGDLDVTVPYQNSVDVYNQFIKDGATTQTVTMTTLPFATHESGVTPYIIDFINRLVSLK